METCNLWLASSDRIAYCSARVSIRPRIVLYLRTVA
jgi:hypothetical protein